LCVLFTFHPPGWRQTAYICSKQYPKPRLVTDPTDPSHNTMSRNSTISMSDLTLPPSTKASQPRSFLLIERKGKSDLKPPVICPVENGTSIVIRKVLASIGVSRGRTEAPTFLNDVEKWTLEEELHEVDSKFFFYRAGDNEPPIPITKIPTCIYTDWNGQTTIYPGSNQMEVASLLPPEESRQIMGQRGGCSTRR